MDFSMLEINPGNDSESKEDVLTTVPATPMAPVPGKDLHLTLLILPTLEEYTSRVAHGIKSHPWGNDHNGLSYRVEKIAWVDEKAGRCEERDGEARHKRLKTTSGSKFTVPPLHLGTGKKLGMSSVVTAAA